MTISNHIVHIVTLSLALASAGCASTGATLQSSRESRLEPAPPEVGEIAIVRLTTPISKSSAIPLGRNRYCTCLHNFPMKEIALNLRPTGGIIFDGGGRVDLDDQLADWAILEADEEIPFEGRIARIVPDIRPAVGDPVYLIGYGTCREGKPVPNEVIRPVVQKQVFGGVATTPSPFWFFAPRDYIYVRAPCDGAYKGCSGGLVVWWSEQYREWVGIGMYFMYKLGTHVCVPFRTTGDARRFIPYRHVAEVTPHAVDPPLEPR